jgi:hypothetical protein
MNFSITHPYIIELYINTLTLHLLKEKLDIIGSDNLADDLKKDIEEVANQFSISAQAAEKLFGSSDVVQDQLNAFVNIVGDA